MSGVLRAALACGLVAGCFLGCGDSGPTAPETPTPPAFAVTFEASAVLQQHEQIIHDLIEQTTIQTSRSLPLSFVQFTVSVSAARSIPGWGLGGYALSPSEIEIVIDPNARDLGAVLATNLPPVVAHELHHTARLGGVGFPTSLLDALVLEGLADVFATELLGIGPLPWDQAFSESEIDVYWDLAQAELNSAVFDFDAWFLRGDARRPPWTGYTLGFLMVRETIEARPGSSASSLVFEPSNSFRR